MEHRIEARIAALEAELNSLKALVSTDSEAGPHTSDRRGMMKLMAATAVGAVTGAALLGAQPAAAADTDNALLGVSNQSESPTQFSAIDTAVIAVSQTRYGIESDGDIGNAWFPGSGEAPLGFGGEAGALFVDGTGDWWAATTTDPSSAIWRKIAGAGTAGSLHLLPSPIRVYDSRPGQQPDAGPKAPTSPGQARTVDTTLAGTVVPPTATAVLITLTINAPSIPGFASVWPSGDWPGTSNINFSANQDIAVSATVGCGPNGSIQVLSNAATNVIIDVSGFYQ